ncbi:hypothetical protein MTR_8g009890 [Medicago truncatula]|uniref:Uncharacterized protein n=1 Tax=Medicago truncatula TaxID=3880 RepID=A0A072TME2_MEDTR|nr:hypothetical protein MTR_8g009890 [Medicago truncatula]
MQIKAKQSELISLENIPLEGEFSFARHVFLPFEKLVSTVAFGRYPIQIKKHVSFLRDQGHIYSPKPRLRLRSFALISGQRHP